MMIQGKIEEMSEVTAKTGKIYRKIKVNGKTYQDFQNDIGIYHITGKVGDEIAFEVFEKKVGEILYRNIVKQVDAQVQKVQLPVKIQPKKEVREELRDEETSGEPIRHEDSNNEILVKIDNLERHLAGDRNNKGFMEMVSEDIHTIKNFISKDYDSNWEMVKNVIQTQSRIEEMIKLIAKKIGIEQSEEFRKASEI